MRKLASIQKINAITPIKNADAIELVHINGWQCVAKKNEFKVDDLCVYFEIDSFLPICEQFEFLRSSSYKKNELIGEGFRIKTVKMRGELSQGLALPLSNFDVDLPREIGTDVSDILNVKKYEFPERATTGGTTIGFRPSCIPKTDETRIQNVPDIFKEFANIEYYISTKMDGSSHSVSLDQEGVFHVTGHNYEYKDDGGSSFYELVKKLELKEKLELFLKDNTDIKTIVLQGEFCGPGIQQNKLKLLKPEWYVFTCIINDKRTDLNTLLDVCEKLNIKHVPIEEVSYDLPSKYPTVQSLLDRTTGNYEGAGQKEGIVIRPVVPVYSETLETDLSIKVINNNFLLKSKD